ncbi:hypothetical protein ACKXGF_07545 [Alkalibacillus sp. S2W]|uniref:hypothetical protein n=1 Tax=Alkalibacillus sp. S2W TaxID=3386553 RepID=UPI00398CAB35
MSSLRQQLLNLSNNQINEKVEKQTPATITYYNNEEHTASVKIKGNTYTDVRVQGGNYIPQVGDKVIFIENNGDFMITQGYNPNLIDRENSKITNIVEEQIHIIIYNMFGNFIYTKDNKDSLLSLYDEGFERFEVEAGKYNIMGEIVELTSKIELSFDLTTLSNSEYVLTIDETESLEVIDIDDIEDNQLELLKINKIDDANIEFTDVRPTIKKI